MPRRLADNVVKCVAGLRFTVSCWCACVLLCAGSQFWALFRRNIGTEAVLKVRCSQGLRPSLYYGSCHNRSGLDVDLPLIDSDKSIMVNLVRAITL